MLTRRLPSRRGLGAFLAFCILCLCWGSTFIPLKEGLGALPPLLFAGLRFVLAGSVFVVVLVARPGRAFVQRAHLGRVTVSSLLVITLNYGLLFWGAQFLPSGISGLVSFGSVALVLTGLSLAIRSEAASRAILLGLACGLGGLGLLIVPHLGGDPRQVKGVAAIALAGLIYGSGSLLVRPLIRHYGALPITAYQMTLGGSVLLLLSWRLEAPGGAALAALREPNVFVSLLYLVVVGSLLGFWLYNRLLARWEASRLALYNFVSPLIALFLGAVIYRETFTALELVAALCLLAGVLVSYVGRMVDRNMPATRR